MTPFEDRGYVEGIKVNWGLGIWGAETKSTDASTGKSEKWSYHYILRKKLGAIDKQERKVRLRDSSTLTYLNCQFSEEGGHMMEASSLAA